MDSLDFWRTLHPTPKRDEADATLMAALGWIANNALPERLYTAGELDAWALRAGYSKSDNADLIALLREVRPLIAAPSSLATAINDAITARRSLT